VSINRYDASTDGNEKDIVRDLRAAGISVVIIRRPCDLLCGWRGTNTLLEVKRDAKAPSTPAQIKFQKTWRGQHAIVWTSTMAIEAVCGRLRLRRAEYKEPDTMTSEILQAAADEITRTIDDLRQTLPGLQCSFLVTIQVPPSGVEATFSTTHDIEQAAEMMSKILQKSVDRQNEEQRN
jgi:hypothetical protein